MWERFLRDERGSATVEFVIWVPLFAAILWLTVDTCLLFLSYTQMQNASRDAARRLTTGQLATDADVMTYVQGQLLNPTYQVRTTIAGEIVTVEVGKSIEGIAASLIFENLLGQTLVASTTMRKEPGV